MKINIQYLVFAIFALVALAYVPTFWLGAGTLSAFSIFCFVAAVALSALYVFFILRSVWLELRAKSKRK